MSNTDSTVTELEQEAQRQGLILGTYTDDPRKFVLCRRGGNVAILGGCFSLDEVRGYLNGEEI